MVEFKIEGTDITAAINVQEYNINQTAIYESWTDGNLREHRNTVREKIAGTFPVGFASYADLQTFVALLNSARQPDGYYNIESSVNNLPDTVEYQAFIETTATGRYDDLNGRVWLVMTVTVTER